MIIELTTEKINGLKAIIQKTLEDEFWAGQRIATGADYAGEIMTIITAQRKREGATAVLNAMGIGVDPYLADRTVEFWELSTEKDIK